jgi:hypothetical protein
MEFVENNARVVAQVVLSLLALASPLYALARITQRLCARDRLEHRRLLLSHLPEHFINVVCA